MARPKKLTLDFFIHSANARNDRRIKSLRRRENNDGYATYYILLEMSCSEKEMKLHLDNEIIVEDIADECGLRDVPHLYKVIESCVSVGLFNPQLWKSERIVFSDDLYNSYLDRLEDRKATAERKKNFLEAKSLQEKINQVTQENPVVTQENPVVTQENPVVTRDNPPYIEIRNTEDQKYRTSDISEGKTENLEIFIQVFNSDAPKTWIRQQTIDSFTTNELLRFVKEFQEDSAHIFQNGLLEAQKDPYWNKRKLSIKNYLAKNLVFDLANKYLSRSPDSSSDDREAEKQRLMQMLGGSHG